MSIGEEPNEEKINGFTKWEIEDAVRTLREAEKIKQNPKLMQALKPFLADEIQALTGLEKLRAQYSKAVEKERGLEPGIIVADQDGGKSS